jgi:perosamine synthetase
VHVVELAEPRVCAGEATFSWTVTPRTELYERTSFTLRFPDTVDLEAVPALLWWRIGLLCLHAHWPLLRPCRIVLPVSPPAGEVEFWLRLTDAAVSTLQSRAEREDDLRSIELVGLGPPLAPPTSSVDPRDGVVSCFSGGRDSTVQAAILSELGERPTLVTTTSPTSWSNEHETRRRRDVLDQIRQRRDVELVEVQSDFRRCWENSFAIDYGVSVNELTDTFLYLAAAIVVGAARGARLVLMASEAEVQQNARRGGTVIQARHFMYSAVTLGAISALFAPSGLSVGSLTSSVRQFQLQRLLAGRFSDLRDLQYSCWELELDEAACSRCTECRAIALNLIADGVTPAVSGIDLATLLLTHEEWMPGERLVDRAPDGDATPPRVAGRAHEVQELRCLQSTPVERVAALLDGAHPAAERERALAIFTRLRAVAMSHKVEPEPGYMAGYLELVDDRLRDGLRRILAQHFEPAPTESYAAMLRNTRALTEWLVAPLHAGPGACARPAGVAEQAPPHAPLELGDLVPGPEPRLTPGRDGRLLRVAEPSLGGNELAYVRECFQDNWISSAGSFIGRFEQAFADSVGARFAVACSSGTAALHLALAAVEINAADEVIVPAFTMVATANAAVYLGADPVLVDADPRDWNLDPERLGDKLTRRTRAVIAVHTYGQPADMTAVREFAHRNGLLVIEDAAEAHGARHLGLPVGSIGDVAAFSFYGNKIITTGEGGMLTTGDQRIADRARELRDHAFSRERHFWHSRTGFNYRMTNLQAAVGLAQTERLRELLARRRRNADLYRRALSGIEGLGLAPQSDGGVPWMFGVRVRPGLGIDRDELRRRLAARGVETRTFFVPLHAQPVFRGRFPGQRYPVAEELGRTGLYLPSGPDLSGDDIAYVADAIIGSQARDPAQSFRTEAHLRIDTLQ